VIQWTYTNGRYYASSPSPLQKGNSNKQPAGNVTNIYFQKVASGETRVITGTDASLLTFWDDKMGQFFIIELWRHVSMEN
jgi:hypothetical protein